MGDCDDLVAEWILQKRDDLPPGKRITSFEEFQAFLREYDDDEERDAET